LCLFTLPCVYFTAVDFEAKAVQRAKDAASVEMKAEEGAEISRKAKVKADATKEEKKKAYQVQILYKSCSMCCVDYHEKNSSRHFQILTQHVSYSLGQTKSTQIAIG